MCRNGPTRWSGGPAVSRTAETGARCVDAVPVVSPTPQRPGTCRMYGRFLVETGSVGLEAKAGLIPLKVETRSKQATRCWDRGSRG
jgi:hypothetical protein